MIKIISIVIIKSNDNKYYKYNNDKIMVNSMIKIKIRIRYTIAPLLIAQTHSNEYYNKIT